MPVSFRSTTQRERHEAGRDGRYADARHRKTARIAERHRAHIPEMGVVPLRGCTPPPMADFIIGRLPTDNGRPKSRRA
ncbi:hypothetical protein [Verminephrobacter eiseniae]|uniref:hypothetical protein n=1 Tax=Verminephrobacter eiseniae TaxID=364317 RepID=UPI00223706D3|nr:hypothetical protein [Verminephrobacter eiseniae]MCW5232028.1 hypothetical protein [Verminephrobacter eiseniae]MCW5296410.1 hypothetical protein [Verminephrobacter eiseniae]MCW8184533.1 hypothetical protein [Verminephrobacter eiseniae]MCW8223209.1 hypothetical protein [Verminephrobacter eiseniae]MCW8234469.1 hypothetical protein [Verminephrobacter eiseniae]